MALIWLTLKSTDTVKQSAISVFSYCWKKNSTIKWNRQKLIDILKQLSYCVCSWKNKPFKCHLCNQSFYLKKILKIHIASVHKWGKPFKCEFFSLIPWKQQHFVSIHDEKKTGKCITCDLKSSQNIARNTFPYPEKYCRWMKYQSPVFWPPAASEERVGGGVGWD